MITMNELVDLRMQQHIAHEIYRQQIMQRIPGKLLPLKGFKHRSIKITQITHPPRLACGKAVKHH